VETMKHLHQADHDFNALLYRRFRYQERRLEREAQLAVTESTDAQELYSAPAYDGESRTGPRCDGDDLPTIGCALGCTGERARQLQESGLAKMRLRLTELGRISKAKKG